MKSKIIWGIAFVFVLVMSAFVNAEYVQYDLEATLEEGEEATYTIGTGETQVKYNIKVSTITDIEPFEVRFVINGETIESMEEWDIKKLNDGAEIKIKAIEDLGGTAKDMVTFLLKGRETPEGIIITPVNLPPTLDNYPEIFSKEGKPNMYIVVGDQAHAEDVIASIEIYESLKDYFNWANQDTVGMHKLASEIYDPMQTNVIVVGNACNNFAARRLLGNPEPCNKGLSPGEGMIKIFNFNGYTQLLVAGYDERATRDAARVLANWQEYSLQGTEARIKDHIITYRNEPLDEPMPGIPEIPTRIGAGEPLDEPLEETMPGIPEIPIRIGAGEPLDEPMPEEETTERTEPAAPMPEEGVGDEAVETTGRRPTGRRGEVECSNGCRADGRCLPFGTRIQEDTAKYCGITGYFNEQKQKGESCQNNYECETNQCGDGVCLSFVEELRETRGLLEKIFSWMERVFG